MNLIPKKQSAVLVCLLLICVFFVEGAEDFISSYPKFINSGEEIRIDLKPSYNPNKLKLKILSPNELEYYPNLFMSENGWYYTVFDKTHDKGFLKINWNQYKIHLLDLNGSIIEEKYFYLKDNKTVYFTIYIDDIGARGFPNRKEIEWYHEVAGPINWGYQCDDFGCPSLKKIIKEYVSDEDYIFHHFHAQEFTGNRIILNIDNFINWYKLHHDINLVLSKFLHRQIYIRDRHIFIALLSMTLILFIIYLKKKNLINKMLILFSVLILVIFLIASQSSQYTHNSRNISIKIDDTEWCRSFLRDIKTVFQNNDIHYPRVTRHGWNLPPASLNEFYIKEMNVISDASAIWGQLNLSLPNKDATQRSIDWRNSPEPYYTNINEDFNSLWDGKEEHRGVLEVPLTMDNIDVYGFLDKDKQMINELPNGALISTYLHPGDSMQSLKPVMDYISDRFEVKFVSALEYCEIYMRNFPRPIIIDLDEQKSYWAYYADGQLEKICETEQIDIQSIGREFQIEIKTRSPLPYLGITSKILAAMMLNKMEIQGKKRTTDYFFLMENVKNGLYIINY